VRKELTLLGLALLGAIIVVAAAETAAKFRPKDGFVPTKEVAVRIAVAVWEPIYGAERIASQKPYVARLTNGIWIVQGSLSAGALGGVAEAHISKEDGRIISVIHGQ
jgi:NTF2 fold immunity protein